MRGRADFAIVFLLATSGLRGSELCQLSWGDLECFEGRWSARFIEKGGREAEQELYGPAVEACLNGFKNHFHRKPRSEDALFWTFPRYKGDEPRPMKYHTLWNRIKKFGETARLSGIIERDINFTPHLFRRSYATCLYKSGMKIKAIQTKTRHISVEVLMKHYIRDDESSIPYIEEMLG